jgi:hypothetical protein
MTVFSIDPTLEPELIEFGRVLARASIFFMTSLGDIVDVTRLREGDEEYDYLLDVPADRLDAVSRRIGDLERTIRERFEIDIKVKTRATSG